MNLNVFKFFLSVIFGSSFVISNAVQETTSAEDLTNVTINASTATNTSFLSDTTAQSVDYATFGNVYETSSSANLTELDLMPEDTTVTYVEQTTDVSMVSNEASGSNEETTYSQMTTDFPLGTTAEGPNDRNAIGVTEEGAGDMTTDSVTDFTAPESSFAITDFTTDIETGTVAQTTNMMMSQEISTASPEVATTNIHETYSTVSDTAATTLDSISTSAELSTVSDQITQSSTMSEAAGNTPAGSVLVSTNMQTEQGITTEHTQNVQVSSTHGMTDTSVSTVQVDQFAAENATTSPQITEIATAPKETTTRGDPATEISSTSVVSTETFSTEIMNFEQSSTGATNQPNTPTSSSSSPTNNPSAAFASTESLADTSTNSVFITETSSTDTMTTGATSSSTTGIAFTEGQMSTSQYVTTGLDSNAATTVSSATTQDVASFDGDVTSAVSTTGNVTSTSNVATTESAFTTYYPVTISTEATPGGVTIENLTLSSDSVTDGASNYPTSSSMAQGTMTSAQSSTSAESVSNTILTSSVTNLVQLINNVTSSEIVTSSSDMATATHAPTTELTQSVSEESTAESSTGASAAAISSETTGIISGTVIEATENTMYSTSTSGSVIATVSEMTVGSSQTVEETTMATFTDTSGDTTDTLTGETSGSNADTSPSAILTTERQMSTSLYVSTGSGSSADTSAASATTQDVEPLNFDATSTVSTTGNVTPTSTVTMTESPSTTYYPTTTSTEVTTGEITVDNAVSTTQTLSSGFMTDEASNYPTSYPKTQSTMSITQMSTSPELAATSSATNQAPYSSNVTSQTVAAEPSETVPDMSMTTATEISYATVTTKNTDTTTGELSTIGRDTTSETMATEETAGAAVTMATESTMYSTSATPSASNPVALTSEMTAGSSETASATIPVTSPDATSMATASETSTGVTQHPVVFIGGNTTADSASEPTATVSEEQTHASEFMSSNSATTVTESIVSSTSVIPVTSNSVASTSEMTAGSSETVSPTTSKIATAVTSGTDASVGATSNYAFSSSMVQNTMSTTHVSTLPESAATSSVTNQAPYIIDVTSQIVETEPSETVPDMSMTTATESSYAAVTTKNTDTTTGELLTVGTVTTPETMVTGTEETGAAVSSVTMATESTVYSTSATPSASYPIALTSEMTAGSSETVSATIPVTSTDATASETSTGVTQHPVVFIGGNTTAGSASEPTATVSEEQTHTSGFMSPATESTMYSTSAMSAASNSGVAMTVTEGAVATAGSTSEMTSQAAGITASEEITITATSAASTAVKATTTAGTTATLLSTSQGFSSTSAPATESTAIQTTQVPTVTVPRFETLSTDAETESEVMETEATTDMFEEYTSESVNSTAAVTIDNNATTAVVVITSCPQHVHNDTTTFPATTIGNAALSVEKCPDGRATASAFCGAGGIWRDFLVISCSATISDVLSSLEGATLSTSVRTALILTSASNISAADVANVTDLLSMKATGANVTNEADVAVVAAVFTNLAPAFKASPTNGAVGRLLGVVETMAFKQNITTKTTIKTYGGVTISVAQQPRPATGRLDVTVPPPASTNTDYVSSITIPQNALPGGTGTIVKTVVILLTDKTIFPPNPTGGTEILTGPVASISVGSPSSQSTVANLTTPIEITWNIANQVQGQRNALKQPSKPMNVQTVCAYLDLASNGFSQSGVQPSPGSAISTKQTCQTNHLTSFVLFTKISFPPIPPTSSAIAGSAIAMVSFLVVALAHISFRRIRRDPMSHLILQISVAATIAFMLHLVAETTWAKLTRPSCLTVAILHYFFLLLTFGWLAFAAFAAYRNIEWPLNWILLYSHCEQDRRNAAMRKFSLVVYPTCIVITAIVMGLMLTYESETTTVAGTTVFHANIFAGQESCLMQGPALYYGFAIPAGLMFVVTLLASGYATKEVTANRNKKEILFQGYMTQFKESKHLAEHLLVLLILFTFTWAIASTRLVSDQWGITYYATLDHIYAACAIVLGVVSVLIFCYRASHVRVVLRRAFYDVFSSQARYALPNPNQDGTYVGNMISYNEHDRVKIELRQARTQGVRPISTEGHLPVETSLAGPSTAPAPDERPNSPGKMYDTSDAVAKGDLELTKGRIGLVGYKRTEEEENATYLQ